MDGGRGSHDLSVKYYLKLWFSFWNFGDILMIVSDVCNIEFDRWCAGFRRSTARLWQVPCLDTSGFSLVFWLKTRLWQVSHMISGISQMFRMVVKMMPGIKILQVCDDFDEFVSRYRMFMAFENSDCRDYRLCVPEVSNKCLQKS